MAVKFELSYRSHLTEPAVWVPIILTTEYAQALKLALHLRAQFDYAVQICLTDEEHTLLAIWTSRPIIHPATP